MGSEKLLQPVLRRAKNMLRPMLANMMVFLQDLFHCSTVVLKVILSCLLSEAEKSSCPITKQFLSALTVIGEATNRKGSMLNICEIIVSVIALANLFVYFSYKNLIHSTLVLSKFSLGHPQSTCNGHCCSWSCNMGVFTSVFSRLCCQMSTLQTNKQQYSQVHSPIFTRSLKILQLKPMQSWKIQECVSCLGVQLCKTSRSELHGQPIKTVMKLFFKER